MPGVLDLDRAIREPDVSDGAHYRRRVTRLAIVHPALFASATIGLVLLVWRARFFVTLSQRSNVETLTIAFFLLFFTYVALLSARGTWGGLRVLWYRAVGRVRGEDEVEARKIATLGRGQARPGCSLNLAIERSDRPGEPFELEIGDRHGSLGHLFIDGVRLEHRESLRDGSNNFLAFFVRQVCSVTGLPTDELDVIHWKAIDSEDHLAYLAQVDALRALGKKLDEPLWPLIALSPAQCRELERRLGELGATLRDEAFLPHWEFEGEHKVPIIPEPLGVISLSRRERRVDPLSSMTSMLVVVLGAVLLFAWFILRPPWVPGR
jgi:hypothetical protein